MKSSCQQPGVYVLKLKGKLLYVGSTTNLHARPKRKSHAHKNRIAAQNQADETELIPCESIAQAQRLEQHLIITKCPLFNLRNASAPPDLEKAFEIARKLR
jgi:excinuclease UvrABC nuclease subunit